MTANVKIGRVTSPPEKPWMVYDGDCNFCTLWIRRWQQLTGNAVTYLPSQAAEVAARFPEIPHAQFAASVQLIEPDGSVYAGAAAVFRALAKNPKRKWPLAFYESFPPFAKATEWAYRCVAQNRMLFSRLTRWGWGRHVEVPDYFLTRWLFLRGLGLIYLIAFISFWTQVNGLIGHEGILPAGQFMSAIKAQCHVQGVGLDRFHLVPTLCWINSSDGFLHFQCAAGTVLAALLFFDLAPIVCLTLLWMLYLSLVTVGGNFYAFQWDNLLLEAGFLAIFLAPLRWLPWQRLKSAETFASRFSWRLREHPPSRAIIWLLRLLLFKLMFSSGCVKLLSGDPSWRHLTALTYHYQTQPLPPWTAWYANQLPLWFQKFSCVGTFCIELGAPFLIFAPRRLRFLGGGAIVFLQILILLTGNFTFFNWLALALCLLLLDDFILQKIVPRHWRNWRATEFQSPDGQAIVPACPFEGEKYPSGSTTIRTRCWPKTVIVPITIVIAAISIFEVASLFGAKSGLWTPIAYLETELAPFRTINSYGLFAVMTTNREEIVVEGSNDGKNWKPYAFKYKPGNVKRRPAFVEPLQPRLDWQMWFAALGNYRQNPRFLNFCQRLLQGSPPVLALLAHNPFAAKPPRYIRAELYDYRFTNFAERSKTGAWWRRKYVGEYLPPISLRE